MSQPEFGSSSGVSFPQNVMSASGLSAFLRATLASLGLDFQGVNVSEAAGLVRARALRALPEAANDDDIHNVPPGMAKPDNVIHFPTKKTLPSMTEEQKAA